MMEDGRTIPELQAELAELIAEHTRLVVAEAAVAERAKAERAAQIAAWKEEKLARTRQPAAAFAGVARTIAKGDPPGWLAPALEHFSHYLRITSDTDDLEIEKNMLKAAKYLEYWLDMYIRLAEPPWNFDIPDDFFHRAIPDHRNTGGGH
jgi:hypothetical protein